MAATYVHLSGRDIDNAIMQAHGRAPKEGPPTPKLNVKSCPKCRMDNTVDATYCVRCGSPLDIDTAMRMQREVAKLKEAVIESLKDEKLKSDIARKARKMKKERGGDHGK